MTTTNTMNAAATTDHMNDTATHGKEPAMKTSTRMSRQAILNASHTLHLIMDEITINHELLESRHNRVSRAASYLIMGPKKASKQYDKFRRFMEDCEEWIDSMDDHADKMTEVGLLNERDHLNMDRLREFFYGSLMAFNDMVELVAQGEDIEAIEACHPGVHAYWDLCCNKMARWPKPVKVGAHEWLF